MEKSEILTKLCIYDERNPDSDVHLQDNKSHRCHCDNCCSGRTELALELLKWVDYCEWLRNFGE